MSAHVSRSQKLLRRVARASNQGKKKRILETQHMYFESYDARLIAVLRAARKKEISISLEDAKEIAKFLKLRKNVDEPIEYYFKKKENGDYRPICVFGIIRTAQKILCKDALQIAYSNDAQINIGLVDYCFNGGPQLAGQRVLDLVHKFQCKFFVVCDIQQCFEYFNHDAVIKELLLPGKIIKNCILIPKEATLVSLGDTYKSCNSTKVRRGIPQGSLTSNLAVATLLKLVIDQVPHHGMDVIYNDGILIGAASKKEAKAILIALENALLHCSVGPMYLKEAKVVSIFEGFDFLGYRFQKRPNVFGGKFSARASIGSRNKFYTNLIQKCLEATVDDIWVVADQYALNWLNSFRLWEMQDLEEDYFLDLCRDIVEAVEYARSTFGENVDVSKFSFDSFGCHYNLVKSG